jgi:hypothetical protein
LRGYGGGEKGENETVLVEKTSGYRRWKVFRDPLERRVIEGKVLSPLLE